VITPIAILDRDGTICEERGYLTSPDQNPTLLPKSAEAIAWLNRHGWTVVGASNQSGVARGYITAEGVEQVNHRLIDRLATEGARLERIYFCPHHPLEQCACRKPEPGLIQQIVREYCVSPSDCVMVGDKDCDVELGQRAGVPAILVMTGYGADTHREFEGRIRPAFVAGNLLEAAHWITEKAGIHRAKEGRS